MPVAGMGVLTVAAPLILMAVAAGVSAYSDSQRKQVTALLEKLRNDALARERAELNGCRVAIENATAVVLDKGHIGHALGLDSAVQAINVAVATAHERVTKWQRALDEFGDRSVELARLRNHFDGAETPDGGDFRAYLELADLAITLNKRVIVLQAVDQAQIDPGNPLENFMKALKRNQKSVMDLEIGITDVRRRLSAVRIDRSHGVRDIVLAMGDVDTLLHSAYRLRELGDGVGTSDRGSDVAIEMIREKEGSVVVLPAYRTGPE